LIATTESRALPAYKKAVMVSGPEDIVCTDRITGNPASWLAESIKDFEKRPELGSKRWLELWSAGKSVAQVEEVKPAGTVIREMVEECIGVCRELGEWISRP